MAEMVSIQGDRLSGFYLMGGKPFLLGIFVLHLFNDNETLPFHIFTAIVSFLPQPNRLFVPGTEPTGPSSSVLSFLSNRVSEYYL